MLPQHVTCYYILVRVHKLYSQPQNQTLIANYKTLQIRMQFKTHEKLWMYPLVLVVLIKTIIWLAYVTFEKWSRLSDGSVRD